MKKLLGKGAKIGGLIALPFVLGAGEALAQSTTTPNTGAGADMLINLSIIALAIVALVSGALYLKEMR